MLKELVYYNDSLERIDPNINVSVLRNRFSKTDIEASKLYLNDKNSELSLYGDEGLQKKYEEELAKYFSQKKCILMNSGTNSLLCAYFCLGLNPGDEVMVPVHSFYAIATLLIFLGLTPILIDCDKETGNIMLSDIKNKITDKTKAISVNHLCGHPCEIEDISLFCKENNLYLIEDISLAAGSEVNGKKVGSFGDITCISLGSTKMLSGGQGGALLTSNYEFFERAVLFGCFGRRAYQNVINPFYRQFVNGSYGTNSRMHSIAIAISYSRFQNIEYLIEKRHKRFDLISNTLGKYNIIIPPITKKGCFRGSWHGYYAIYDENKHCVPLKKLIDILNAEGLQVTHGCHYSLLNEIKIITEEKGGFFRQKANPNKKNIEVDKDFKNAKTFNDMTISFPLFLDESMEYINEYVLRLDKVLQNFYNIQKEMDENE